MNRAATLHFPVIAERVSFHSHFGGKTSLLFWQLPYGISIKVLFRWFLQISGATICLLPEAFPLVLCKMIQVHKKFTLVETIKVFNVYTVDRSV